jgi:hypothetical protein
MPRLACFTCGRQIYTVAPLESLFAEERRCPRCGAYLNTERRESERRQAIRRVNPPNDPGPPRPKPVRAGTAKVKTEPSAKGSGKAQTEPSPTRTGKAKTGTSANATEERRVAERRTYRRRGALSPRAAAQAESAGWQD